MMVGMPLSSFLLLLTIFQVGETLSRSPSDRVFEFEIETDEPIRFVYESNFEGSLHLWTRSKIDLTLRVERGTDRQLLADDDNSGGGNTPYVLLDVKFGDKLMILCDPVDAVALVSGSASLHLIAAPETEETRNASAAARLRIRAAIEFVRAGKQAKARALLQPALTQLQEAAGADRSQSVADALRDLGHVAYRIGRIDLSLEAWVAASAYRKRTLPADHLRLWSSRASLASAKTELGEFEGAYELERSVLDAYERLLPANDPELTLARECVALSLARMGEVAAASALFETILQVLEQTLPADDPEVSAMQENRLSCTFSGSVLAESHLNGVIAS